MLDLQHIIITKHRYNAVTCAYNKLLQFSILNTSLEKPSPELLNTKYFSFQIRPSKLLLIGPQNQPLMATVTCLGL